MDPELRELTPDDDMANRRLMSHAFSKGSVVEPTADNAPPPEMRGVWGVFENGELCASLSIQSYTVHWGSDATLPMGGIAGVATWAEARRRGHVDALLRQSLRVMKDAGQVVSALYPFAWAFYRRYGWDWVGEKRQVEIPLRELRAAPEGKSVTSVGGSDKQVLQKRLQPGYEAYARLYRGMFAAGSHQWKSSLRDDDGRTTYAYLYEPTGEYFLWRYDRDGSTGTVREWTARTPEAHRALLSVLHYLGTQCATAKLALPADSPLWSHLMHWDLKTRVSPQWMGRVVDVAGALAALPMLPAAPDGSLMLRLHDEYAPWNEGLWQITVDNGKVFCVPCVGGNTADIEMDSQAFSQAFWGTPSLMALRRAGRLSVTTESAFPTLASLLPNTPVFSLDDF